MDGQDDDQPAAALITGYQPLGHHQDPSAFRCVQQWGPDSYAVGNGTTNSFNYGGSGGAQ